MSTTAELRCLRNCFPSKPLGCPGGSLGRLVFVGIYSARRNFEKRSAVRAGPPSGNWVRVVTTALVGTLGDPRDSVMVVMGTRGDSHHGDYHWYNAMVNDDGRRISGRSHVDHHPNKAASVASLTLDYRKLKHGSPNNQECMVVSLYI